MTVDKNRLVVRVVKDRIRKLTNNPPVTLDE